MQTNFKKNLNYCNIPKLISRRVKLTGEILKLHSQNSKHLEHSFQAMPGESIKVQKTISNKSCKQAQTHQNIRSLGLGVDIQES